MLLSVISVSVSCYFFYLSLFFPHWHFVLWLVLRWQILSLSIRAENIHRVLCPSCTINGTERESNTNTSAHMSLSALTWIKVGMTWRWRLISLRNNKLKVTMNKRIHIESVFFWLVFVNIFLKNLLSISFHFFFIIIYLFYANGLV